MNNINNIPVGICSQCRGIVSVPKVFYSVKRPVPTCEKCGAKAIPNLPVIETTR